MKNLLLATFLLVFVATAFVTILGIAGKLTIKDEYLNKLFYLLIIQSIASVIALFKKTSFFGDKSSIDTLVLGCWWQFVLYRRNNALSFFEISYSEDQQQLVLHGRSFNSKGEPFARWWSVCAAINAATLELRYFWKGDHEAEEEDFSGVGSYRFKHTEKGTVVKEATGWYLSGNIDQLSVTGKQKVEVLRASENHCKIMLSADNYKDQSELVQKVLSDYRTQFSLEIR